MAGSVLPLGWSHGGVNQEGNDGRARPSPAPGWSGSLGLLCSGPAPRGSARVQHRSPVLGRRGPSATACPSPWGSSAVSVALPGDRGAEPLPAGPPVSFTPSPHSVSLGTERGAVVLWGHRDRAHSAGERRSGDVGIELTALENDALGLRSGGSCPRLRGQLLLRFEEGVIPVGRAETTGAATRSTQGGSPAPAHAVPNSRSKSWRNGAAKTSWGSTRSPARGEDRLQAP